MKARTVLLSLTLFFAVQAAAAAADSESCMVCHSKIKVKYASGIHSQFDISCTDCHGGDPGRTDMGAMAPKTGFRGKIQRDAIPGLCASCHSDPIRMKPFDLPTSQLAEYFTSVHGKQLMKGDTNVAVCTDCHGIHGILPGTEPNSMVASEKVPSTCAKCHADQALMSRYGLKADQYELFAKGEHGIALMEKGNIKAPNCARCHGIHGASPPGVTSISDVCGQCHIRTREYFRESPHREAMDKRQMSECASCHGNHYIPKADRGLFDSACKKCHPPQSEAYIRGQKIKALLMRATEAIERAEQEISRAEALGFAVTMYKQSIHEAVNYLTQALPVQHTLDEERVEDLARKARSIGEDVQASVHGLLSTFRIRKVLLGLIWVYILFTCAVIYLYKLRLQKTNRR